MSSSNLSLLRCALALIFLICFGLVGCNQLNPFINKIPTSEIVTPSLAPSELVTASAESSNIVALTGWFTTIWNDEPLYSITDDQGQIIQLLLEDEIAKPFGGPLELDRRRITIVGEVVSDSPRVVRVLSVELADPQ